MRRRGWLWVLGSVLGWGLALSGTAPVRAQGIPVIDVANLAQAVQQVTAWARQYQQMMQQYQQLAQTYESLTGRRNLGEILYNPLLRDVLPPEAAQIYNAVHIGGINGLTAAARTIRNASMIYDCENMAGDDQRRCRARLSLNAQTQAYARQALEVVSGRVDQIEQLMRQINQTEDPKAIAELQARLQAETAQVANDQNRIAVLRQIASSEQAAAEQAQREAALRNLARPEDGTGLIRGWAAGKAGRF